MMSVVDLRDLLNECDTGNEWNHARIAGVLTEISGSVLRAL
jgi:hypothetical protein